MNQKQIQHGDVLIMKVKNLPENTIKVKPDNRGIVLAEGESTGHAHTIEDVSMAQLFKTIDNIMYLKTENPVTLKHQEHKPIIIEPGIYEIGRVVEYNPFEKEIRSVAD